MWLGLTALAACGTTGPLPLEIPIRDSLKAPCERLATPAENELPPLSEDRQAAAAQIAERAYWQNRDLDHNGVERRICRQRDEAVADIAIHNQAITQP